MKCSDKVDTTIKSVGERPQIVECYMKNCGRIFATTKEMNRHVRTDHDVTTMESELDPEMIVLSTTTPLCCPLSGCNKSYKTVGWWKAHKSKAHPQCVVVESDTLESAAQASSDVTVDNSSQGFQCPKCAQHYNVKKSLVNHCYEKHGRSYSKGREVGRRRTRGSQPEDSPLPRDPDNPGPRLTGIKGSDLISLLLQTLKDLMTTHRRSVSFSLPTNGRSHIEFRNQKRKGTKAKGDKFGDVFFKLVNNAFYGKTMENVYNRQDVELVNDVVRYNKLVENISFKYAVEFDDDPVDVHKTRGSIKLDKFNYFDFVILEKAKLFMYKAVYDYFEKEVDCSYHYTDADSIFININLPLDSDIETEMIEIKDTLHNNGLGKMSDELPNDAIIEGCFLKAKAYCNRLHDSFGEDKKLKGITEAIIKNQTTIDDYKNAI